MSLIVVYPLCCNNRALIDMSKVYEWLTREWVYAYQNF